MDSYSRTIHDVARAAGVSARTVSRVLNQSPRVAAGTRERVLAMIEALDFHPSASARSLVTRRRNAIGLIFPYGPEFAFTDPFLAAVVGSAGRVASAVGVRLVIVHAGDLGAYEDAYMGILGSREVDGVLVLGLHPHSRVAARLRSLNQPFVLLDRPGESWPDACFVDADNLDGGFQAGQHLASLGHRRVAVIDGPANNGSARERHEGFAKALSATGVTLVESRVGQGDYTEQGGYQAALRLLAANERPTGLFVANDRMAIGALRAVRERGFRVPNDVSVVGFDDIELASYTAPPLTTIRQDAAHMGEIAARMLLALIAGQRLETRQVILPVSLVVRASTASAPGLLVRKGGGIPSTRVAGS